MRSFRTRLSSLVAVGASMAFTGAAAEPTKASRMVTEIEAAYETSGARELSVLDIARRHIDTRQSEDDIAKALAPEGFKYFPSSQTGHPGAGYRKRWVGKSTPREGAPREIYIYIVPEGDKRVIDAAVIRVSGDFL